MWLTDDEEWSLISVRLRDERLLRSIRRCLGEDSKAYREVCDNLSCLDGDDEGVFRYLTSFYFQLLDEGDCYESRA